MLNWFGFNKIYKSIRGCQVFKALE